MLEPSVIRIDEAYWPSLNGQIFKPLCAPNDFKGFYTEANALSVAKAAAKAGGIPTPKDKEFGKFPKVDPIKFMTPDPAPPPNYSCLGKAGARPKPEPNLTSLSDTRPHSQRNLLSECASRRKPDWGSSHHSFEQKGMPWGVPFIENAEPVKPDAPDIFKGYFCKEDTVRMTDADMVRRRKRFENYRAAAECKPSIPREI